MTCYNLAIVNTYLELVGLDQVVARTVQTELVLAVVEDLAADYLEMVAADILAAAVDNLLVEVADSFAEAGLLRTAQVH